MTFNMWKDELKINLAVLLFEDYVDFKEDDFGDLILVLPDDEWMTLARSFVRRSVLTEIHMQTHLGKT